MKRTRRVTQLAFLALTLIGVFVVRGHAERWCPFGGVEALYAYLSEGNVLCALAVTNFFMLAGVLLAALLLRRAFCGYACPVGTLSEWLGAAAARLGLRPKAVPPRADAVLRKLKYGVLAVILYFTWTSSELLFRTADPCYALISRHGEDITGWAYAVAGLIVVASLPITMPFCRWLCPLAAVLAPFARVGLTRVRRDPDACTGCRRCSAVCPTGIPVHTVTEVRAARCLTCFNCLDACPPSMGALAWGPWRPRRIKLPPVAAALALIAILGGSVGWALLAPFPSFTHLAAGRTDAVDPQTAHFELTGLTCRGRATLLTYFLERDDEFAIDGFLKIEAWPAPQQARVQITYDATGADEAALRAALTEAYYDRSAEMWRVSPFVLEGDAEVDAAGEPSSSDAGGPS